MYIWGQCSFLHCTEDTYNEMELSVKPVLKVLNVHFLSINHRNLIKIKLSNYQSVVNADSMRLKGHPVGLI